MTTIKYFTGQYVFLMGKSPKGKSKINQHGRKWLVKDVRQFRILLRSMHKTNHNNYDGRWVHIENDKDFIL